MYLNKNETRRYKIILSKNITHLINSEQEYIIFNQQSYTTNENRFLIQISNATDNYSPKYSYKLKVPFAKLGSELYLNRENKLLKWNQLEDSCSRISSEAISLIKNHQRKPSNNLNYQTKWDTYQGLSTHLQW